MSGNVRMT